MSTIPQVISFIIGMYMSKILKGSVHFSLRQRLRLSVPMMISAGAFSSVKRLCRTSGKKGTIRAMSEPVRNLLVKAFSIVALVIQRKPDEKNAQPFDFAIVSGKIDSIGFRLLREYQSSPRSRRLTDTPLREKLVII